MAMLGSYARFLVGLALAVEVLHNVITGAQPSIIATGLAVAFLALSAAFFVFKF